jgi:2-keto-4-pentenoate hydratase/2-oxohepta-3-ene-1,7-dioic acid hydratase in catechol pathway
LPHYVATDQGFGTLGTDGSVSILDPNAHGIEELLLSGVTPHEVRELPVVSTVPADGFKLHAPVARPVNLWAVGYAYAEHSAEVGHDDKLDEPPMLFLKACSSITGPFDDIRLPALAPEKVDYEGEIAVVMGRRASSISAVDALDYVLGYTAANDVSARDVQRQGLFNNGNPDPSKGKSFDTFTPLGPCICTLDEYADPNDVELSTFVDGERRQHTRSSLLINSVAKIVAFASQLTTLSPGDVILTGTPAGVGHPTNRFLAPGSVVRIEVEGVGAIENTVVSA